MVTILIPGKQGSQTLTIPHCHLSEVMRTRLDTLPAGQVITKQLITIPQGSETRMMYGPDMQLMATAVCLVARLEAHCQPGFVQILQRLDLEITLPEAS